LRTSTWIVRALPLASACLIARQRDLLALRADRRTVAGAKIVEQALLVGLGEGGLDGGLAQAGRLQLFKQHCGRAV
jgi:hypothetical protein